MQFGNELCPGHNTLSDKKIWGKWKLQRGPGGNCKLVPGILRTAGLAHHRPRTDIRLEKIPVICPYHIWHQIRALEATSPTYVY